MTDYDKERVMSEIVERVQMVPNNPKIYEDIEREALTNLEPGANGEVLCITRMVERSNGVDNLERTADVMLVFPTEHPEQEEGGPTKIQPAAVRFTLNTFLNVARSLALMYGVVQMAPEAYTDGKVPNKILTP